MIIALQSAIVRSSSVDGGRSRLALVFADSFGVVFLVLVVHPREVVAVLVGRAVGAVASACLDRTIIARDEVPEDLLGEQQAVLQLADRVRRGVEEDDVVRALTVTVDRVREPTSAPRGHLEDLPARRRDLAGRAV